MIITSTNSHHVFIYFHFISFFLSPLLTSKFKLCTSLVTSILLYGCETWTLPPDSEKRIQTFESKCLGKPLRTFYFQHKTNDWVRSKVNSLVSVSTEPLLATVKRRKLAWFGHVTRHNSLSKTILQGTLEGGRCCGRQRKCWKDDVKEWTSLPMPELLTMASSRKDWMRIFAESSVMPSRQPDRSRD